MAAASQLRPTLVVARYKEDLTWLRDVPDCYDVVVYNKSTLACDLPPGHGRRITVHQAANVGREAETYCRYILDHYDRLPRLLAFAQGDPFAHSPDFLDLLRHPETWEPFQPLTSRYVETIPPEAVYAQHSRDGTYVERMSCFTLGSVRFNDAGVCLLRDAYLSAHGLPGGTNIMHHYFRSLGLPDEVRQGTELVSFNYAAMFAARSENITARGRAVFEAMLLRLQGPDWFEPSIAERGWMTLLRPQSGGQVRSTCT